MQVGEEHGHTPEPTIATVIELGYEMPYVSALGVFVPKATSEDLVRRIEDMVAKVTKEPQFVASGSRAC